MYKGVFYDRQLQQKFQVEVSFSDFNLQISCPDFSVKVASSDIYVIDQKDKETIAIKIGKEFPFSVLEVSGAEFVERILRQYPHVKVNKQGDSKGYAVLLLSLVVGIGLVIAGIAFTMPLIGEYLATMIPKEHEIKIGQTYYDSYKTGFRIDTVKTKAANDILKILDFGKEYPLEVTVIKDNVKNAYALPGGHIVIYDKILKDMTSVEELVALLAHESTHINKRHATKTLGRTAARSMVVSMVFGNYDGLASMGNEFLGLSYSRDLEKEADVVGIEVMVANKVNPQGMIALFENLKKDAYEPSKTMKYMSTHPLTDERIADVNELIKGKNYDFQTPEKLKAIWVYLK